MKRANEHAKRCQLSPLREHVHRKQLTNVSPPRSRFGLGIGERRNRIAVSILSVLLLLSSPLRADETESNEIYLQQIKPLLKTKCISCHGPLKQESGLRLDTAQLARQGGDNGPAVVPRKLADSLLYDRVSADSEDERMPPEGEPLTAEQLALVKQWIESGAIGPASEQAGVNPAEHWSFQTVRSSPIPSEHADHPIDAFIRARLAEEQLTPSPPAAPRDLVRRFYLDLHGLPPDQHQMQQWLSAFSAAESPRANRQVRAKLIDHLLESPRYGERWAQHWLDVVRYADTHGFEVNTPRPNAWPYRDFVITSFNEDLPYDQFVFRQLAGDSVNDDAATGFLVAAPVLLPGQIGADDVSKRLARQDSLDEIIVGTTATIMGLTVGCARCHDHKFDPVTQRDYYAFQAFFAGVTYGDRPMQSANQQKGADEALTLVPRIDELTISLRAYEPLAGRRRTILIDDEDETRTTHLFEKNGHGTNPAGTSRGYKDDVGSATHLPNLSLSRYTWWDNHAGRDTFTWNPATAGTFEVWLSWGVHGSGVHTRDARYVLDLDGQLETTEDQTELARADQYYFAGVTEGETEKKPMWSGFFNAGIHELSGNSRIILRGGETGTGITADVLLLVEAAADDAAPEDAKPTLPIFRRPVSAALTVERFEPTLAKFVRLTTLETIDDNKHQPCIDELEVYRAESTTNVALATAGAIPTSSGNISETGIHQLKHVNDGKYGNSWSWISNEFGGGWVQLEFPQVESIDRIEWARDREEKFKDRLPIRYHIDISLDGKQWVTVASHYDRQPMGTPYDQIQALVRSSVEVDGEDVQTQAAELDELKKRKAKLEIPQMTYAGVFRKPDVTRLLSRGDPEQPLDELAASVPAIFGEVEFADLDVEQNRRVALAKWLTRPDHPLTARVLVNRVWQGHFGRGIVDTPSDFGLNGIPPTHPELLDWLADSFVKQGWSIKSLHRLILTSDTYSQSTKVHASAMQVDADNRLLWRFAPRRLEGEAIRDSILFVNQRLNFEIGGPGFDFFKTRGGLSGFPPIDEFGPQNMRRMIYSHKIRMEPVPVFGVFDCPDAGQPTPRRTQSTTPLQALNLLNSPFVLQQAQALAELIEKEHTAIEAQVTDAFQRCLCRPPDEFEFQKTVGVVEKHGLSVLCRALYNSNEFLFLP